MDTQLLKGLLKKYIDMIDNVEDRQEYFKHIEIYGYGSHPPIVKGKYTPSHSDFDRIGKLIRKETLEYEHYFDREKDDFR